MLNETRATSTAGPGFRITLIGYWAVGTPAMLHPSDGVERAAVVGTRPRQRAAHMGGLFDICAADGP